MSKELWARERIVIHPNTSKKDENGRAIPNYHHRHILREWNYPRWIIMKHLWYFNWVTAMYRVRFPKYTISSFYSGYYKKNGEIIGSRRLNNISSAKAQVTKYKNKIELLKEHCKGTLFNDYTQHPIYPKLKAKLDDNHFKLNLAIMAKVEETI